MEEKKYLTNRDFFKNSKCLTAKEHAGLDLTSDLSQNEKANATQIFRGIAMMWLRQHKNLRPDYEDDEVVTDYREVNQIVKDSYLGATSQECERAEKVFLDEIAKGAARYCRDEKRWNDDDYTIMLDQTIFVAADDVPEIANVYKDLNDMPAKVHFDAIFITKLAITGVVYKGGKPWFTKTGNGAIERDLWANLMLLALEKLVPEGEHREVKASYYFMRASYEKPGVAWESVNFFNGNNVVTIEEDFSNTDAFKTQRSFDPELLDAFSEMYLGSECSEDDCNKCPYVTECNKKVAPVAMEFKQQKRGKRVTPSASQQEIIDWNNGILAVIAGAGAGKTECVAEHVVSRIKEYLNGIEKPTPEQIRDVLHKFLMTTFTNAGCNEMKDRITGKLSNIGIIADPDDLKVVTFNTFSFDICKEFYQELGFKKVPTVIDNIRFSRIAVDMLNENPISGLDYENFNVDMPNCKGALAALRTAVERMKSERIDHLDSDAESKLKTAMGYNTRFVSNDAFYTDFLNFYKDFQVHLYNEGLMLFADQEPMALKILDAHPDYLEEQGFERIIIDEFQDSNAIQMEIVKRLSNTKSFKSMVVVGDDFQAIYSFRDTTPDNMIHFDQKIGKTVTFKYLVDNYRSTPEILDVANKFIKANKEQLPKDLISKSDHGKLPIIRGFYESEEEYEWILGHVKEKLAEGYLPEEIAILTRNNTELDKLAALLTQNNIQVVTKNPVAYMKNTKVLAAISLRNALFNPESSKNYFDYLSATEDSLFDKYSDSEINAKIDAMKKTFTNLVEDEPEKQRIIFHQYLEAIKGNDEIYEAFLSSVYNNEDFASEIQYMTDFGKYGQNEKKRMEQSYQGIVLSTAHSAKGLEWPVVFVSISKWDTVECHRRSVNKINKDLEESRRLLYVAMTRARKELFVSGLYTAYGSQKDGYTYNQFLKELYDIVGNVFVPVDPELQIKKVLKENEAAERRVKLAAKQARKQNQNLLAKCNGDPSKLSTVRPAVKPGSKSKPMSDAEIYAYNQLIIGAKQVSIDQWMSQDERFIS